MYVNDALVWLRHNRTLREAEDVGSWLGIPKFPPLRIIFEKNKQKQVSFLKLITKEAVVSIQTSALHLKS